MVDVPIDGQPVAEPSERHGARAGERGEGGPLPDLGSGVGARVGCAVPDNQGVRVVGGGHMQTVKRTASKRTSTRITWTPQMS